MRYKPVPSPRPIEDLYAIRDAVPLVPGGVDDCCSRIVARTDVAGRDSARTWLTFLTALGLVTEGDRGYYREQSEPAAGQLGERYLAGVFGASEIRSIVATHGEIGAENIYDELRPEIPDWERNRRTDWEATWRERTARLLAWGVTFDVLDRTSDGAFTLSETE